MVRSVAGAGSRTGAGAGARGGAGVGPFLRQRVRCFVAWDVGMTRYPNDLRGCVSKERVEEGLRYALAVHLPRMTLIAYRLSIKTKTDEEWGDLC